MVRIFCDQCGGTDGDMHEQPNGQNWCDFCCERKCYYCEQPLRENEDTICNHPSCIEKRAEDMFK